MPQLVIATTRRLHPLDLAGTASKLALTKSQTLETKLSSGGQPRSTSSGPPRRTSGRGDDHLAPGEWVRYDQLERKETRLRPDQYSALSELSRALNRQRQGRGERITENTLIRVAIDLLLKREAELVGVTEAELRASLGL